MPVPFLNYSLPGFMLLRRGKVRDIYDLGETLLLIATDRISAFDLVLSTGVPDKGRVLTQLSAFWFKRLRQDHHLVETDVHRMRLPATVNLEVLAGRTMQVRKTQVVPIECVVRGYLAGSGWQEYQRSGTVCGLPLPAGLREGDTLPEPIFTPATKEESGHDINITFGAMEERVGDKIARLLRSRSIEVYKRAAKHALQHGIIIADTKFEWGTLPQTKRPILIDEVCTPDSSRFWPVDLYRPGCSPPSFDKQFVRDWLIQSGWDKQSAPPPLPPEVVDQTRTKYIEAYERLTGKPFAWK